MFDFDVNSFLFEIDPERCDKCEDRKPHFPHPLTTQEEIMRVRETVTRLLKFKEHLDCVVKRLGDDNKEFKDTLLQKYAEFLEVVKNECNLFEITVRQDYEGVEETVRNAYREEFNTFTNNINAKIDEFETDIYNTYSMLKTNINTTTETVLRQMRDEGSLTGIISTDVYVTPDSINSFTSGDGTDAGQDYIVLNERISNEKVHHIIFPKNKVYSLNSKIKVKSNTIIDLNGSTIRRAGEYNDTLFLIEDVENVTIKNGKIINATGVLSDNSKSSGMSVIISASRNVTLENLEFSNCTSDAIYIGYQYYYAGANEITTENITVRKCKISSHRNGISLVSGNNIYIEDNVFHDITKYEPKAGIDIEPETGASLVTLHLNNVYIRNNRFVDCSKGINVCQFGAITNEYYRHGVVNIDNNIFDGSTFAVFGHGTNTVNDADGGLRVNFVNNKFVNFFGNSAIVVDNNPFNCPLLIKDTLYTGRLMEGNTDYSYYGFITIIGSNQTQKLGNITIDNIIIEDATHLYPFPSLINVWNGSRTGAPIHSLTIKNIHVDCDKHNTAITLNDSVIGDDFHMYNVNITKKLSNYYVHDIGRYTDVIIPTISQDMTLKINEHDKGNWRTIVFPNGMCGYRLTMECQFVSTGFTTGTTAKLSNANATTTFIRYITIGDTTYIDAPYCEIDIM